MNDVEILAVANPLMDNLMEGSREVDHAKHVKDFTPRLKGLVTEEGLRQMCDEYQSRIGFFTERELACIFRRKGSVAVIWRQSASKSEDEFVASIVIVERDGRYLVDHALIY